MLPPLHRRFLEILCLGSESSNSGRSGAFSSLSLRPVQLFAVGLSLERQMVQLRKLQLWALVHFQLGGNRHFPRPAYEESQTSDMSRSEWEQNATGAGVNSLKVIHHRLISDYDLLTTLGRDR